MESFAIPLPATVMCELLGVPYDDCGRFRTWTDAFMSVSAIPMEEKLAHRASVARYLADMVAQRRARPADDLIGALVRARDEQDRLTEDEMITFRDDAARPARTTAPAPSSPGWSSRSGSGRSWTAARSCGSPAGTRSRCGRSAW